MEVKSVAALWKTAWNVASGCVGRSAAVRVPIVSRSESAVFKEPPVEAASLLGMGGGVNRVRTIEEGVETRRMIEYLIVTEPAEDGSGFGAYVPDRATTNPRVVVAP